MRFERRTFSVGDYVIFALMLAASAAIGIFYAVKDRKKQNTKELLFAGRYSVIYLITIIFSSAHRNKLLFLYL